MTAEEAKEYGMIDNVLIRKAERPQLLYRTRDRKNNA